MGQAVGGKLEKAFRAVEGEVDATRAPPFRLQDVDGVKLQIEIYSLRNIFTKINSCKFLMLQ